MTSELRFEPGAPASSGGIALCEPYIRGNEWKYVKECLDTGLVSSIGPYVRRFEQELAVRVHSQYAVATVNGTSALHVALLVAGVRPDDEVLMSDVTFIAPANAVRYVGAWPVFIDAEPEYWQMDTAKVKDFLERECRPQDGGFVNRSTGRRVKAIMPVHILGHPVDMQPICEIASRYGLVVIEDATESLGATYRGEPTGSIGDIACFSFNGNKIITTGGGGMITTNHQEWSERAEYLTTQAKDDALEFVHGTTGYNYRLSNIAAAVGVAQLEMLDGFVEAKRKIAHAYDAAFADLPGIRPMREAPWAFCTFWLYTILVDETRNRAGSRDVIRKLAEHKIQARPLWQPMHRSPALAGCQAFECTVADELNRRAISLPCSAGLKEDQQQQVIDVVRSTLG